MVCGVAQVRVYGSKKYAVRVQVDPNQLAAREIGLKKFAMLWPGQYQSAGGIALRVDQGIHGSIQQPVDNRSAVRPLIVEYRNGNPVRLDELGKLWIALAGKTEFWVNDNLAMVLAVQKQPGANTVEVVDGVKALMP